MESTVSKSLLIFNKIKKFAYFPSAICRTLHLKEINKVQKNGNNYPALLKMPVNSPPVWTPWPPPVWWEGDWW